MSFTIRHTNIATQFTIRRSHKRSTSKHIATDKLIHTLTEIR